MKLPPHYRDLLFSDLDPGDVYRRCVDQLRHDGLACDYELTEAIVYACEVRYALEVLRDGPPDSWWNFGDPTGDAESRLWAVLDPLAPLRLAFVGSGPYPVTAVLVGRRYPDAEITCFDNNMAAHILGAAVLEAAGSPARAVFADAAEVDYEPFNAVLVAAMVTAKRSLVERILGMSDALVVVRSEVGVDHERVVAFPSPFSEDGTLDGRMA